MNERVNEAEMSLIGSMFFGKAKTKAWAVTQRVSSDMFGSPPHARIWSGISELLRAGKIPDLVLLRNILGDDLAEVGGDDYLIQLAEFVPSPANLDHYAGIVIEAWARRVIQQRLKAAEHATNNEPDMRALMAKILDIGRGSLMPSQSCYEIGDVAEDMPDPRGVPTGLDSLDKWPAVGGMPCGQLTVIGAATGIGKTSIALQIARKVAEDGRVFYGLFGDLNQKLLQWRIVKQLTGYMGRKGLSLQECADVDDAFRSLTFLDMMIYDATKDNASNAVEDAISIAMSEHYRDPFSLLVFDYAQLMTTREKTSSPMQQMEHVSRKLSECAARIESAPVLLLSQLDTDGKGFRYSQQFKNDAGWAWILRRNEENKALVEAECVKTRFGGWATVQLGFDPKTTTFCDL